MTLVANIEYYIVHNIHGNESIVSCRTNIRTLRSFKATMTNPLGPRQVVWKSISHISQNASGRKHGSADAYGSCVRANDGTSNTLGTRIQGLLGRVKQFKRPPSEGVHLLRFRFVPAFKWVIKWTAPQDPTAVNCLLLRIPNHPQDAVVLPVHPVLQCHYSLMCPLACVNTVYINILMFLFHVAPQCAQLACGQS